MRMVMVAGESSGDILGAGLIRALRTHFPQLEVLGVGGQRMQAEGLQPLADMERLSVMGFIEPLERLPELFAIKKRIVDHCSGTRVDVFVGIDSPGFNLRVEREVHDLGIPTVHYVGPTVWAWGQRRIHSIARAVDLVLTLLPFESAIYEAHNIPHCFVGHPLADQIAPQESPECRQRAREHFAIPDKARVLALMPGSRSSEVHHLGPVFLQTAAKLLARQPDTYFILPCASSARCEQLKHLLQKNAELLAHRFRFILVEGQSHEAMRAADVVILASGTATLEAMLLRRPMIVCYRMARLNWWLASRLVRVKRVSLPNLLADKDLVPEYLQDAVSADRLVEDVLHLLNDTDAADRMCREFERLHLQLRRDADSQAAAAIQQLLSRQGGA